VRVLADGQTHRQTDRQTDANRFYNLSHAICYSYGTDNNTLPSCRSKEHAFTTSRHWQPSALYGVAHVNSQDAAFA